MDIISSIASVQ